MENKGSNKNKLTCAHITHFQVHFLSAMKYVLFSEKQSNGLLLSKRGYGNSNCLTFLTNEKVIFILIYNSKGFYFSFNPFKKLKEELNGQLTFLLT